VSIGDLSSKLKDKINQDRKEFEKIAHSELESLQRSLSASSQSALRTIEADISGQLGRMSTTISESLRDLEVKNSRFHRALAKTLARSTALGLCLILGGAIGTWLLTMAASRYALELQKDVTELREQRKSAQQTLATLEKKTWGVQLLDTKEGRFIILPPKTTAKTGWTIGKRPAIKLE
jgi:electron transfer flavoprotein alpha subunit